MIKEGFPEEYFQFHNRLVGFNGVILYHDQIVISPSLCNQVLQA